MHAFWIYHVSKLRPTGVISDVLVISNIIRDVFSGLCLLSDTSHIFCIGRTKWKKDRSRRRMNWRWWKKMERNHEIDEALSGKCISIETDTKNNFCMLWDRNLRVKVNRSAALVLVSFMEVTSPVAWSEANKCLETKEEFDLNTRGSPLKAGHWLLHYACSLPCLCPYSSSLQHAVSVQHPSSFKFVSLTAGWRQNLFKIFIYLWII